MGLGYLILIGSSICQRLIRGFGPGVSAVAQWVKDLAWFLQELGVAAKAHVQSPAWELP